jgi:hypothetical protein
MIVSPHAETQLLRGNEGPVSAVTLIPFPRNHNHSENITWEFFWHSVGDSHFVYSLSFRERHGDLAQPIKPTSSVMVRHSFSYRSLENPSLLGGLPGDELLRLEPESNLLLGALDAVGAVADVAANRQAVVAADGARGRGKGVGGTEDGAASLDSIKTLPDHGADGARVHVVDEASEEGLGAEISIVLLEVLLAGADELEGNKLEAAVLEAGDDGANESTLDTIGLDGNEGLLGLRHFGGFGCWRKRLLKNGRWTGDLD